VLLRISHLELNILPPQRRPQSVSYGVADLRHENVYETWDTPANIRIVATLSWKFFCFTLRAIYPPEKDLVVLFWELGGSEVNE
jgi:hypothetical protein